MSDKAMPKDASARSYEGELTYPDREPAPARVETDHREAPARTARAVRTLATCWGLAVVAVFLPLLHFVLVPGLLVLGPVLAYARLHEADTITRAEGDCPACAAHQAYALGQRWRERTVLRCDACGRRLELHLPPAPPTG